MPWLERSGGSTRKSARERAAPTVRSAERWGPRLSRWCVRRSGPGGRRSQQEGRAADERNLGRDARGKRRDEQERQVHTHGHRVRQLWVAVILGIVRPFDFRAET